MYSSSQITAAVPVILLLSIRIAATKQVVEVALVVRVPQCHTRRKERQQMLDSLFFDCPFQQ